MIASETTEARGLDLCQVGDAELIERDEVAGLTSIRKQITTTQNILFSTISRPRLRRLVGCSSAP